FADLHDRAGRMKAKGTIRQALQWSQSRRFFYWRLRRRLNEEYILRRLKVVDKFSTRQDHLLAMKSWICNDNEEIDALYETNDRIVASWLEENRLDINKRIKEIEQE